MLEDFVLFLSIMLTKVWLTPPSPPTPSHETNKQRNLFLNVIFDTCLMYLRGRSSPLNFHDHMSFNVDLRSANIASWLGVSTSSWCFFAISFTFLSLEISLARLFIHPLSFRSLKCILLSVNHSSLFYFLLSPLLDFVTSCSVCGNLGKKFLIIDCLIFLFLLLTVINILKLCTRDQLCPFLKLMGWPRQ